MGSEKVLEVYLGSGKRSSLTLCSLNGFTQICTSPWGGSELRRPVSVSMAWEWVWDSAAALAIVPTISGTWSSLCSTLLHPVPPSPHIPLALQTPGNTWQGYLLPGALFQNLFGAKAQHWMSSLPVSCVLIIGAVPYSTCTTVVVGTAGRLLVLPQQRIGQARYSYLHALCVSPMQQWNPLYLCKEIPSLQVSKHRVGLHWILLGSRA